MKNLTAAEMIELEFALDADPELLDALAGVGGRAACALPARMRRLMDLLTREEGE